FAPRGSTPSPRFAMIDRRLLAASALALACGLASAADPDKEEWQAHKEFARMRPVTIAVLPMDNLSLEPGVEEALYKEVYDRLATKGYAKISVDHVSTVMKKLGVTIPGLLAGFSAKRLGEELQADGLLFGQIEQSARINQIAYDAIVVSCSLRLVQVESGTTIWYAQQWRAAKRQWQLDPVNALINSVLNANASREARVAYLVQEMLKTLPDGPIEGSADNLLDKAKVIGR
ncbi:MAG TPA: GNA1162 family protein, partial [Vicinamibacterales bacterium]|nr:GNA1162 family protein [Vicinamibacterales bacterium]